MNRAIESLKLIEDTNNLLTHVKESRNEIVYEATLGFIGGFDGFTQQEISHILEHVNGLVLNVIKSEGLISTIISIQNDEPISNYHISHNYQRKYLNWVIERFEKNEYF